MSQEQCDGEGSVGETGTDRFVDASAETEVEVRLPLEVDMEPDRIRKDVQIYPGAVDLDAVGSDPKTQRPLKTPERGQTEVAQTRDTVTPLWKPAGSYRGPGHNR